MRDWSTGAEQPASLRPTQTCTQVVDKERAERAPEGRAPQVKVSAVAFWSGAAAQASSGAAVTSGGGADVDLIDRRGDGAHTSSERGVARRPPVVAPHLRTAARIPGAHWGGDGGAVP